MISKRHWMIAGALAISMHAAAFYAVFYSVPEGSQGAGEQGIEFDLGMMGDMGDAAQSAVAQDDAPPPTKPVEKAVKKSPPKPAEPKPVEKKSIEKKPEPKKTTPQVAETPRKEPKPEPVVKKVVPTSEPKVVAKPPSVVKQTSPIHVAKVEPKNSPKPPQEPVKKEVKPMTETAPTAEPQPSTQTNSSEVAESTVAPHKQGPESQAAQKATTGRASSAHNGGNPGAKAKYFAKLAAALAQSKRYPRASRRRNEEGVVTLSFVAHANGEVSDAKIAKSSGFERLDKAVLDMLKRATPLPLFSKDMTVSQLSITLPVSFKLSDY